jgi:hypothetical protein
MTRDNLTSIIQLAGIKRNISEDGMPTPGYDGSGNRIRTVADPKLGAGEGDPFAASATAVPSTGTPRSIAPDGATADSGVGINKFEPKPANVSTQSVAPAVIKTTSVPYNVPSTSRSGSGPSGVDPDVQAQIERLRRDWNNHQSTDVGNNPDYHGDVNPSSGGGNPAMPAAEPESKKKTLAPVDEKLKPIQEKLKALGYDLGPTGIDGRMGKYTRQAIDAFKAGTPPSKATTKPSSTSASTGRGAEFTDPRMVKPGEPPPSKVSDQEREEALSRLEKRARITNENFNKLTPVEQIQKIRHMVDLSEQRDSLGWSTDTPSTPKKTATILGGHGIDPIINPDVRATGPANAASTAGKASKAQVAKAALGSTWKRVAPGAGAAFGAYDAYHRGKEGDWLGAGLAGASAIASFFPGLGTAIALGLDATNIARDYAAGKFDDAEVSPQERAQIEQDWRTLEPYYRDTALFKSLPAKDQARLTRLKQKAAEVAATEKK